MSGGLDTYDAWMDGFVRMSDPTEELMQEPVLMPSLDRSVTVPLNASIRDAVNQMRDHSVGCVLVLDGERLAGIFTERDVLNRVTGFDVDIDDPVAGLMTPDPACSTLGDRLATVLAMMLQGGYRHVPIVDNDGKLMGVFGMRAAMRSVLSHHEDLLLTAPPTGQGYCGVREGA